MSITHDLKDGWREEKEGLAGQKEEADSNRAKAEARGREEGGEERAAANASSEEGGKNILMAVC